MVEFPNDYRRWHLVFARDRFHAITIGFNAFPLAAQIVAEVVE